MRGENLTRMCTWGWSVETSPHAWRKLYISKRIRICAGNISTCVEKTLPSFRMYQRHRKHLHMRGENSPIVVMPRFCVETSPHAWRKHVGRAVKCASVRNISTCVEKTDCTPQGRRLLQKHLHMRGENTTKSGLLT